VKKFKTIIKYLLLFLISFILALYFLDLLPNFGSNKSKPNDPIQNYSKMPFEEVVMNGKKVKVYSGVSNLSGSDLFNKMKEDIVNNTAFKLIHENSSDNKYYLTYSEGEAIVSVVIINHADSSSNYQIYKADESVSKENAVLVKTFLAPPDAISILNLKGKKDQMVYSYTTRYTESEVFAFYRKELPKLGYHEEKVDLPEKLKLTEIDSNEILFRKDRKDLTISVTIDPAGNGTMVYIVGS
jgi:hypothetical protein